MRATVRAVLPVRLALSHFSSTAITPQSSHAPAGEAAHTSHSGSDPTEPWPSSYLLAAVLEFPPRLQAVFQEQNTSAGSGAYQMTVAHRQLSLSSGWNLVSIPVSPLNTVITQTLYPVEGKHDLSYAYPGSDADDPWKKYNTAPLRHS